MEAGKETKFGTEVAYEMPERQIHAAQRKCAIPHSTMKTHHYVTYVVVTVLCNQSEAFASHLSHDQSRFFLC